MGEILDKKMRLIRMRELLLQDMPRKEIMKLLKISESTYHRYLIHLGKEERNKFKTQDYVFSIKVHSYNAKRRRIINEIKDIYTMITQAKRDEYRYSTIANLIMTKDRMERTLEQIDKNFDDYCFRAGLTKEIVPETLLKVRWVDPPKKRKRK